MHLRSPFRFRTCVRVVLLIAAVVPGSLAAQDQATSGFQMSAMSYDSLGFQIRIDDEAARYRASFDRLLESECSDILRRNGITAIPARDAAEKEGRPVIIIDLTIEPLRGGSGLGELYYGSIAFQRAVTFPVLDRQLKARGATWSMTFGGQAQSRLAIVSDVEARLLDFLEDYLKVNSARWIWQEPLRSTPGE